MSLVAWWPLDGDTNDKIGGNHGSGSPSFVDGKIGDGIQGDGANITVSLSDRIESAFTGNQMSLSVWWKEDSHTDGDRWSDIIEFDSVRLERAAANQSSNSDYWCNIGSGDGDQLHNDNIGVPGGEWFNLVIRRKGDDYEIWINGELDRSGTRTADMNIGGDLIFNPQDSGSQIDDIRLYDHAISEKRIAQLSKAKVLHYKFNQNNPDILERTDTLDTGSSQPHGIGYDPVNDYVICTDNSPQVARFEADTLNKVDDFSVSWAGSYVIGVAYDSDLDVFWMMDWDNKDIVKVDPSDFSELDRYNVPSNPNSSQDSIGLALDDSGHLYGSMRDEYLGKWDKETGSNAEWMNVQSYADVSFEGQGIEWNDGYLYIGNSDYPSSDQGKLFVAEWGESVTQFGELTYSNDSSGVANVNGTLHVSSRDDTRQERFYIGGDVTDASGFENNGDLNGPAYVEDTKIGSGAYEFDNENSNGDPYEHIASPNDVYVPEKFTLSAWLKDDNSAGVGDNVYSVGWHRLCFNGGDSDHTGMIFYKTDDNYQQPTVSGIGMDDGNWHLHTMVVDSITQTIEIYFDGQLIDTQNTGEMRDVGSYRQFIVGSAWSRTYGGWDGKIDDVRVYATTFSQNEVQELHANRASIDSGGNIHAHEVSEIVDRGLELEAFSRGNNS